MEHENLKANFRARLTRPYRDSSRILSACAQARGGTRLINQNQRRSYRLLRACSAPRRNDLRQRQLLRHQVRLSTSQNTWARSRSVGTATKNGSNQASLHFPPQSVLLESTPYLAMPMQEFVSLPRVKNMLFLPCVRSGQGGSKLCDVRAC